MDRDLEDRGNAEETESKFSVTKVDVTADNNNDDLVEEDEEEEEEEEDRIIEKSPNLRFHKRNKKYMRKVTGIDNSFIAIEPKSGKEVIWNEINLSDKKTESENRFIILIKKLKRYNHPFLVRFLDVWQTKPEITSRKIIFITERLTDPTMKQYFVNSSSSHRLTNKSLWKKFVGQLMSVLKFLNHLGVNHGNLSNETVYYQNTGCLKVGILSVDLTFDNKPSSDIYEMGKLALEMAAYDTADDVENLSTKDRIQKMLQRVTDTVQCSFIQMCLDNAENPTTLSKLFQHVVLKEIPSLKRLAANTIVRHTASTIEDEKVENPHSLASHLKDQVSHFEDETVLIKVAFFHDNITKLRLWKEFRINNLSLPKYIEDVRNGFYPIFEAKSGQVPEDADDITYLYSVEQDNSKDDNMDSFKDLIPSITKPSDPNDKGLLKDNIHETKIDDFFDMKTKSDSSITIQGTTDTKIDRIIAPASEKTSAQLYCKDTINAHDTKVENTDVVRRGSGEDIKIDIATDIIQTSHPEASPENAVPFEDSAENELDEEEEEEEEDDGGTERIEPYWDYVSPPEKPPNDRALFTGCMYSYIGCGRWQIYVQIWFVEDRLKREVVIQVMEHEWSNDSRVASMFENGKIISSIDKPVLERILGYARHNCPLMEGELIPPQKKLANFDAYDLYQRLEHLQMFAKARQLLEKAEEERVQLVQKTAISPSELSSVVSPSNNVPNPTIQGQSATATPRELSTQHPVTEECNNKDNKISQFSDPNIDEKQAILKGIKIGDLPGFKMQRMDIRVLAPLNHRCMFCDNHDYLHSEELPPYLSSPCYHCREGLAKEAKIPPAHLFDLHQQNLIPWPAFLQVRFNIPPYSHSSSTDPNSDLKTFRDLIDYDCKWRGRVPCHCYPGLVYPPCVEFPNIYSDDSVDGSSIPTYPFSDNYLESKSTVVGDSNLNMTSNPEITSDAMSKQANLKPNSLFPCSNRHVKGATITCVHGVTFPRIPYPSSIQQPFYKKHVR